MGKHSRRRRRVVVAASTLVSSAVVVVATTKTSHNIAALQNNNNDPAAAPTLHITHFSSNNDDGEDSIVPSSSSSQTITTVFSCGTHWRSAQTCGTLCPSGQDGDCPDGQYCYGGIPCTSNDDDDSREKTMDEMLQRQSRLEQQLLSDIQATNDQEYIDKFVCGTSYHHASSSCNTRSSSVLPSRTHDGLHPFATNAIYCPDGTSESCPSNMECYIIAQCDEEKSSNNIISLIDEIGSWLVRLFDKQSLLLLGTASHGDEEKEEVDYNSTYSSRDDSVDVEEDEEDRVVLNEWKAYFQRESGIFSGKVGGMLFASSSSERCALN